jgi:hypothetical protein
MLTLLNNDLSRWRSYHTVTPQTKALEYTDGKYSSTELPKLCKLYPDIISYGEKINDVGNPVGYYQILDKQFECLVAFDEWCDRVKHLINRYGVRAREAARDGAFDRKAMYHAVRIIDEAIELLETGGLILPSINVPIYKTIRFDETCSFEKAQDILTERYDHLMNKALPNSTLQETIDSDFLNDWYKSTQTAYIKKELLMA